MTRPPPVPGLVVRYDYLWHDERHAGRIEGSKDRPCVVVLALDPAPGGVPHVVVAPVTHSPPREPTLAHEIPSGVKNLLGFDDSRSWIVASEINRVRWDDAGFVPVAPDRWHYGRIPTRLWEAVRDTIRHRAAVQSLAIVERKP